MIASFALLLLAADGIVPSVELRPETLKEFQAYMAAAEAGMQARFSGKAPFLWSDEDPARRAALSRGQVVVSSWNKDPTRHVSHGLIHDWVGAIFVPGAKAADALNMLQDFDRHRAIYAPEVSASRLLSRNGNETKSYLRLVKKKMLFTAVIDTEYSTVYREAEPGRHQARIVSTLVQEVENAGERNEKRKPEGTGYGFLWRVNSWWTIAERDDGVVLELRSVTLSRDVPAVINWIIEPMVNQLPRETLAASLQKTAAAIQNRKAR